MDIRHGVYKLGGEVDQYILVYDNNIGGGSILSNIIIDIDTLRSGSLTEQDLKNFIDNGYAHLIDKDDLILIFNKIAEHENK